LKLTVLALAVAAAAGLALALLFALSRGIERALFPYAVILQVTPIVAIAPLIIIWVNDVSISLLICAWIVAFFPILSNTTVGLNSADPNLQDLFRLYGASRWQVLWRLKLPGAMPYFLAGLRISGGLALIGAIVAEFVAGTGGAASGLAYRILESGYQLQIPRMFAALALNPARLLGLPQGRLAEGAPADLMLFDPDAPFLLDRFGLKSKSKNTPFDGQRMEGKVLATWVGGAQVYQG
jgi:NitT/TauT family transport system permease protein